MTNNFIYFFNKGKIIWCSLVLTLIIWISTLSSYDFIHDDPFLFLSKIAALLGTVSMCWTFILSSRLRLFEYIFSGLDKVYHIHRLVGMLSFSLICLHPLFQIARFIPDWERGLKLYQTFNWGSVELGVLSLILFITLIAFTLWIKIPYHIWKKTHEFFIFVLLLALLHIVLIDRQVHQSLLLSIWIYGFIFLAVMAYIYIRFFYRYFGPRFTYKIQSIERRGKIWNIFLEPMGKEIQYFPAQFIYLLFENSRLSKEPHPFSISSSPTQSLLRVTIKSLGDYTSKLNVLQKGDKALIWGPYGKFYEKFLYESKRDAVFIAGGIGITPFLSLLQYEADSPRKRDVYIFYCVKNSSRCYFNDEIMNLCKKNSSFHYVPWYSDIEGLLSTEKVFERMNSNPKGKLYFLCGPFSMMKLFTEELTQKELKSKNIISEDFNLFD